MGCLFGEVVDCLVKAHVSTREAVSRGHDKDGIYSPPPKGGDSQSTILKHNGLVLKNLWPKVK